MTPSQANVVTFIFDHIYPISVILSGIVFVVASVILRRKLTKRAAQSIDQPPKDLSREYAKQFVPVGVLFAILAALLMVVCFLQEQWYFKVFAVYVALHFFLLYLHMKHAAGRDEFGGPRVLWTATLLYYLLFVLVFLVSEFIKTSGSGAFGVILICALPLSFVALSTRALIYVCKQKTS